MIKYANLLFHLGLSSILIPSSGGSQPFALDKYHSLDEIYAYMDALVAAYPNLCKVLTIGTTIYNTPIKAIR